MLKRYCIVAFLLFAFTLVLAHSIIPHHHHDDEIEAESKDHGHHDENSLEHSFEHYMHAGNSTDYFIPSSNDLFLSHSICDCFIASYFQFSAKEITVCFAKGRYIENEKHISSESLYSNGLRGPPLV